MLGSFSRSVLGSTRCTRRLYQTGSFRSPSVESAGKGHFSKRLFSKKAAEDGAKSTEASPSQIAQFWSRFTGPKEMPPRWTPAWYREMVVVCTVFAITGSSTMILVSSSC